MSLTEPSYFRWEHIAYTGKPGELSSINLEKKKLRLYLITTCHYAMDCYRGGLKPISEAYSGRTRGSGHKLQDGKFQVGIRKIFFTVRTVQPWNRCPGGFLDPHLWTSSKLCWTRAWATWSNLEIFYQCPSLSFFLPQEKNRLTVILLKNTTTNNAVLEKTVLKHAF